MQQGAVTATANGHILFANQRFSEMLGVPLAQLYTAPLESYVTVSDRARLSAFLMVSGLKRYYKGRIVDEVYTKLGQQDYQAEITQLRSKNPKAVFVFYPGGMLRRTTLPSPYRMIALSRLSVIFKCSSR